VTAALVALFAAATAALGPGIGIAAYTVIGTLLATMLTSGYMPSK
jgi:hypothetical protein